MLTVPGYPRVGIPTWGYLYMYPVYPGTQILTVSSFAKQSQRFSSPVTTVRHFPTAFLVPFLRSTASDSVRRHACSECTVLEFSRELPAIPRLPMPGNVIRGWRYPRVPGYPVPR
eukprot:1141146-Rhodomonas_salina.1